MSNIEDIFNDDDNLAGDEELLRYLQAGLPEEEKHLIEKKLLNSIFENDALEGLTQFKSKEKLDEYVRQLNSQLKKQVTAKKHTRKKRKIKGLPLIMLVVVIILALAAVAFAVIYLSHTRQNPPAEIQKIEQAK
jgi:hypothetical protein